MAQADTGGALIPGSSRPVTPEARPSASGAGSSAAPPYRVLLGLATGLLILVVANSPLQDVDLYWHLRAARELLAGASPDGLGAQWTFAPERAIFPWVSTQAAAEVVMYAAHDLLPWAGLAMFRLITTALALAVLAWTTLRHRPAALAGFPYLVAALTVALMGQERPQQFTFIGAAVVGAVLVRGLRGAMPPWWVIVLGTVLWANLHGGWVILPGALILIAFGRLVDHGPSDAPARRATLLAVLSLAAGSLTPAGVRGLVAPLRFSQATEHLIEWQPTQPFSAPGSVTILMLLLLIIGWSQGSTPRSEYLVALALVLLSWTAWRNMAPALLMLAPVAAQRLSIAYPRAQLRSEPRWSTPVGVGLATIGLVSGIGSITTRDHLPLERWPITLAGQISSMPGSERVLSDYNVSGMVLHFGGPDAAVSVDGRADRYTPDYIEAHESMMDLRGNWQSLLEELDPSLALIEADSALARVLVNERAWMEVGSDAGFVLLEAPGRTA